MAAPVARTAKTQSLRMFEDLPMSENNPRPCSRCRGRSGLDPWSSRVRHPVTVERRSFVLEKMQLKEDLVQNARQSLRCNTPFACRNTADMSRVRSGRDLIAELAGAVLEPAIAHAT